MTPPKPVAGIPPLLNRLIEAEARRSIIDKPKLSPGNNHASGSSLSDQSDWVEQLLLKVKKREEEKGQVEAEDVPVLTDIVGNKSLPDLEKGHLHAVAIELSVALSEKVRAELPRMLDEALASVRAELEDELGSRIDDAVREILQRSILERRSLDM